MLSIRLVVCININSTITNFNSITLITSHFMDKWNIFQEVRTLDGKNQKFNVKSKSIPQQVV